MEKLLGLPFDASLTGHRIDEVISLVHVLMLILFVGWGIFFILALVKFRRSKHPKATYAGVKSHVSTWLEAGVALFEAVLLIGFSIPIWAAYVRVPDPMENPVVIRVAAEQYAWNIHYPGPDGRFGRADVKLVTAENPLGMDKSDPDGMDDIITINQMWIPAGRPILVQLTSKDVIHCFFIPVLRVKQDAIPGQLIPVPFTAVKTGNYEIACAQLCGLGHYRMKGFLTIQTPEEFDKWVRDQESQRVASAAHAAAQN